MGDGYRDILGYLPQGLAIIETMVPGNSLIIAALKGLKEPGQSEEK